MAPLALPRTLHPLSPHQLVLSHVQMAIVQRPIIVLVLLDIMDQEIIALRTQLVPPVLVKMVVHVTHQHLPTRIFVFVFLDIVKEVKVVRLPILPASRIPVKMVVDVEVPQAVIHILANV